jgi:NADH-quinone oxidoreductase subunit M
MVMQLLQILVVPLAFVFVTYFAGLRWGRYAGWFAFLSLAYSTVITLLVGFSGGAVEYYEWRPIGLFGLKADGLSIPILFTVALLCALISLYSMSYMTHTIGDDKSQFGFYYSLLLLYSIGMMGAVLATDLIEFYLFFELMLIPSYFLIAKWGSGDRDRISFMYFLWTHIGALAVLAGILSVGYLTGTFDLQSIVDSSIPENLRLLIICLMTVGFLVKMASFGLHIWLPHAHAEAPTPISALLSPAMIGIGGYAIVRIVMAILPSAFLEISTILTAWAVVSMFYGGAMALVQDDLISDSWSFGSYVPVCDSRIGQGYPVHGSWRYHDSIRWTSEHSKNGRVGCKNANYGNSGSYRILDHNGHPTNDGVHFRVSDIRR